MTRNQRIFADEYLRNGRNATQAYMAAYPRVKNEETAKANGSRMLTNANVSEYIEWHLEKLHDETIADAAEIMRFYTAVMRGEICEKQPVGIGMGEQELQDVPPKTSDRNAAAEKLARMLGVDKKIERERLELEKQKQANGEEITARVVIVDDV